MLNHLRWRSIVASSLRSRKMQRFFLFKDSVILRDSLYPLKIVFIPFSLMEKFNTLKKWAKKMNKKEQSSK